MPQTGADTKSESVLLGCLVKDHLRLWPSDGRAECVRVMHPADLRGALARGIAPRTSVAGGRFREAGRLDHAGTLRIAKQKFAVELADEPAVTAELWEAAGEIFQHAADAAIRRGEYVMVEPGGWDTVSEPHALAGARKVNGEWQVYVEARPSPRAPSWPEPIEGQAGWGITAPAEAETLEALGPLLADAVATWATSPLEVVLTFGKQPDGAWTPDEETPDEETPDEETPEDDDS
jgi:hypothetical protein